MYIPDGDRLIPNLRVAQVVGVDNPTFLRKIDELRRIQYCLGPNFHLAPQDEYEWEENQQLWEFVHGADNSVGHDIFSAAIGANLIFTTSISEWLYWYLLHTPRERIYEPGAMALAGIYLLMPEYRDRIEQKCDPRIVTMMHHLLHKYFKDLVDDAPIPEDPKRGQWEHYMHRVFADATMDYMGNPIALMRIEPKVIRSYIQSDDCDFNGALVNPVTFYGIRAEEIETLDTMHPYYKGYGELSPLHNIDMFRFWLEQWCAYHPEVELPYWVVDLTWDGLKLAKKLNLNTDAYYEDAWKYDKLFW